MRISNVNEINVHTLIFSSHILIGDSCIIDARSKALAVKREYPLYYGNEGSFAEYPIFSLENPIPIVSEKVQMSVSNPNPNIHVNRIRVKGISSSSILQVGSTNTIFAEAKIKHIRQLLGNSGLAKAVPNRIAKQEQEEQED